MSERGEPSYSFLIMGLQHMAKTIVVAGETRVGTFGENKAVKKAIEQVAGCACQYKRTADERAFWVFAYDQPLEQKEAKNDCAESEYGE